jgi:hypothetical protein
MFDSPMEYCTICRQMVTLDQSQDECAREYGCRLDTVCPLLSYFPRTDAAHGTGFASPSFR